MRWRNPPAVIVVALVLVATPACGPRVGPPEVDAGVPNPAVGQSAPAETAGSVQARPAPTPTAPTAGATEATEAADGPEAAVRIAYRVEVWVDDVADFGTVVEATLSDPRGWQQAGFALVRRDDATTFGLDAALDGEQFDVVARIILAEGAAVDELCLPHQTRSTYSCQREEVVAINADRWRSATPQWTGDLPTYRQMLVNHEVGHLLGQRHRDCPGAGQPAPVMVQQSTELNGCLPNPWPLPDEIAVAARHDLPLAPL